MDKVETGSAALDEFLSGGLPKGHCIEFCGHPGTGKTLLAYFMVMCLSCNNHNRFLVTCQFLRRDSEAFAILVGTGSLPHAFHL